MTAAFAASPTTRYGRPLALFVIGVATATTSLIWHDHVIAARHIDTIRTISADPHVVSASDCPITVQCHETAARAVAVRLVTAAFPGRVTNDLTHAALTGPRGNYRETIDVRTPAGINVRTVASCIANGTAIAETRTHPMPSIGPAIVFVIIPGPPGCSVAVVEQVPAGVPVPWPAPTKLAHTGELQLR